MRTFVLTSDKYLRCLPAFAYLFSRECGEQPALVMCYALPAFDLPPNFALRSMGAMADYGEGKAGFSAGLRAFLESVPDGLFLLLLEDYFITYAHWGAVERLHEHMARRRDVGRIDLTLDLLNRPAQPWSHRLEGMELARAADDAPYQFSFQASLWRRDFLLRFLRDGEDPWRCEKSASKRILRARAAGEDVPAVLGVRAPALRYVNAVGGEGKRPGEWERKRFPAMLWDELSEKGLL